MKLGFYTNYSREIAEFAQQVGFKSLELSAWPQSSLNADHVTDEQIREILDDLQNRGIEVSALGYYPNYFDPDAEEAHEAQRYLLSILALAVRMEVKTVCTFAGRAPNKSVAENIPLFKDLFSRFCEEAEKKNLRIAIENCPMMDQVTMQGINIAFSPEVWDAMFDAVPSTALGLEFDPSHLVWLGVDYVQAVHDYGDRIYHVHAKDMEIDRQMLARVGIYGQAIGPVAGLGHGWWRPRTPGWGDVNWPKFISALLDVNYTGNIDIEHEDEVIARAAATIDLSQESNIVATYGTDTTGLILGYNFLSKLIPPDKIPTRSGETASQASTTAHV
jgi:sugar phosphate isomerase/epimerase